MNAIQLHLDLKGMLPDEHGIIQQLDRLADRGLAQLVIEYEDRYPWQTWPDTWRPGYDRDAWQRIWRHCQKRRIEIIPLIQTLGHLGWLLRQDAYAHLRENNQVSELCPSHAQALPLMKRWVDEVIALHPQSQVVHLGCDETFCLATCAVCRQRVKESGDRFATYLPHVNALAEHVIDCGKTPMIWGDALWHEASLDQKLHEKLVLVDWQYGFLGPQSITIDHARQATMAASALRSADGYDMRYLLGPLKNRLRNMRIWQKQLDAGAIDHLMVTCWARSSSHGPLYGPIEGWWPLVEAACNLAHFEANHPLAQWLEKVDQAMHPQPGQEHELTVLDDLAVFEHHADEMVRRAATWWRLAIRHAALVRQADALLAWPGLMEPAIARFGCDSVLVDRHRKAVTRLLAQLSELRQHAAGLLAQWRVSDSEEFLASRFDRITLSLTAL